MKKYAGIILLAGWALASCDSGTSNSEVSELQGDWQLQSFALNDGSTVPVPNPEAYTAQFSADGSVNVQADCNRCNGPYEIEGNNIDVGLMACTLAFCGDASLDSQYTAALSGASSFVRSGDELLLSYSGGTMRFQLSP
jgi:heat shock protein HslJ